MIELADEFDWAFKGVEMAIAMIADMHHGPQKAQSRSSTSSSQNLKSVSAGQRWGIVSTSVVFQWVSMSYLNAEQKDTKQPCSVLASFLAVERKRWNKYDCH